MHILSIETSCDETAAAIVRWQDNAASIVANTVSSQASLHAKWGGVVPDLASREHIKNIVPVIEETLKRAEMTPDDIDLIAVTRGPGLMPALLVGVSAAKTLALVWGKPLIGINHLEGHIYANFVSSRNNQFPISNFQSNPNDQIPKTGKENGNIFPLVALIVSGGHTQLMLLRDHFQYELLGETQDDAAGEAFDKVAKMLGLPYPGGPIVAQRADAFRERNFQFPTRLPDGQVSNFQTNPNDQISKNKQGLFPRPMLESDNFDFSFSGLKTSVLYFLKKHETEMKNEQFIDMVCHEFQEAVVDVLVEKSKKTLIRYQPKTFTIAGGVSANERLRNRLHTTINETHLAVSPLSEKITFLVPEFAYSLDNAAMIGVAAAYRYDRMSDTERKQLIKTHLTLDPDANLPLQ